MVSAPPAASQVVEEFTSSGNVALYVSLALALLLIITLIANPNGIASVVADNFATMRNRQRGLAGRRPRAKSAPEQVVPPAGDIARLPRTTVRPLRLVVDDLTVRFGGVTAVDSVSLAVEPGKVTGLMGPNGAGKTTLIDAVTGFVAVSSGAIRLNDKPIGALSAAKRAALGISRTFQSLELFEEISVEDNIRVAIEAGQRGVYSLDLIWAQRAPLDGHGDGGDLGFRRVGDDLGRRPGALRGRRRLVSIARAIASEPSVLLLDGSRGRAG